MLQLIVLQLSEELNQQLALAAPLIAFFGQPQSEQIALLPTLEPRKYDFPEGDLLTSNALEVLVNAYQARLNSISIQLMIMQDQAGTPELGTPELGSEERGTEDRGSEDQGNRHIDALVDSLADLVDRLLDIVHAIVEQDWANRFEVIGTINPLEMAEWESLRQLSFVLQQALAIPVVLNAELVQHCVDDWLHP